MAKLMLPVSNGDCMTFLDQASAQAEQVKDEPKYRKITVWFNNIIDTHERFLASRNQLRDTHHLLLGKRGEANRCVRQLSTTVRDFDVVLSRRMNRNQESSDLIKYYRMPDNGKAISYASHSEWKRLAEDRINGDAQAQAMGYAPMFNPSVEDLQACIDSYNVIAGEVEDLDRSYQSAQTSLMELRDETAILWRVLQANIKAVRPELEDSALRRLLRSFGYVYKLDKKKDEPTSAETPNEGNGEVGKTPEQQGNTPEPTEQKADGEPSEKKTPTPAMANTEDTPSKEEKDAEKQPAGDQPKSPAPAEKQEKSNGESDKKPEKKPAGPQHEEQSNHAEKAGAGPSDKDEDTNKKAAPKQPAGEVQS